MSCNSNSSSMFDLSSRINQRIRWFWFLKSFVWFLVFFLAYFAWESRHHRSPMEIIINTNGITSIERMNTERLGWQSFQNAIICCTNHNFSFCNWICVTMCATSIYKYDGIELKWMEILLLSNVGMHVGYPVVWALFVQFQWKIFYKSVNWIDVQWLKADHIVQFSYISIRIRSSHSNLTDI